MKCSMCYIITFTSLKSWILVFEYDFLRLEEIESSFLLIALSKSKVSFLPRFQLMIAAHDLF